MNILSALRLKTKLILMIATPLLAMLYFSTDLLIDKRHQQQEMVQLSSLSQLASTLSALIHETQKERAASAGFTGSKGKKFVDILPKQRKLTDQRRETLKAGLVGFDATQYGAGFEKKLAALLADLKQLDQMRAQISRLELPLPKVVGWYTAMNAKLLQVVEQMPHVVTDAALVARITAYVNYLQSKERAGIERAVLSATFGADQFAPGMYKKFIELVTAQKDFLHVFNAMGSESDRQFYRETMQHESVAQVEQMRETAFSKFASGGFGIDAEHWFKTITQKINQLKRVDDHLAAGILQQADRLQSTATTLFRFYMGLILVLVLFTLWMALRIGGSIRHSVTHMRDVIRTVVEEGDFSVRADIDAQDAVGEMARTLDSLLESLQDSIRETNQVVNDIAHGTFNSRVEADFKGELLLLKQGVNQSAESVERTMLGLTEVMKAITGGDFRFRLDGIEMEGEFRQVLEQAMESMDAIVTDINHVMDAVAKGKFDVRVTTVAQGDLDLLKNNLNRSLNTLGEGLKEAIRVSNQMGEGDLTQSVTGDYRGSLAVLKDSINATQANFTQIVSKVRSASERVRKGSEEISRGSMDLSSRTSEQAASLEETGASMEEMASTVNMNADSASQASQLAAESLLRAEEGSRVVAETVSAMLGINSSSSEISEIISLIDGIAFQTNLLALNAAVEAARAGDHGRGFAVVAGEVRTLAQRSADAAKDIKGLIEESGSRIQQGSDLVSSSGVALDSIEESVKKMNDISSEIKAATKEQTQGINQVNTAVAQLDTVTQENAALVEETAAASSQLSQQADELASMVSLFKLSQEAQRPTSSNPYTDVLTRARSAHIAWKGKIRGFLDGVIEMEMSQAVSHHDCMLGQWLDKEGRKQFASLPEMKTLDTVHEKMHSLIQDIVKMKKAGDGAGAEARFDEIEPLSKEVVVLLDRIESAAGMASASPVQSKSAALQSAPRQSRPTAQRTAATPPPVSHAGDSDWASF